MSSGDREQDLRRAAKPAAIELARGRCAIARYERSRHFSFPLLRDEHGAVSRMYGVVGLPTTFVIARNSHAIGRAVGHRDWTSNAARRLARALLGQPPR